MGKKASPWILPGTLALVLAAPLAAAQAPPAPVFGTAVEVQVVNLDVYITDREGRPVKDLSGKDFQVFEDGRPVELSNFSRIENGSPLPADDPADTVAGAAEPAEKGLHLVVFIDQTRIGVTGRRNATSQLARVLQETLRPEDQVMLVGFDGASRVLLPFTANRKALWAALAAADTISPRQLLARSDRDEVFQQLQYDAQEGPCLFTEELYTPYAEKALSEVMQMIRSLEVFVDSLAGVPGRKAILHLSDGIPLRPGAEAIEYGIELCGGQGIQQGQAQPRPPLQSAEGPDGHPSLRHHEPLGGPVGARQRLRGQHVHAPSLWRRRRDGDQRQHAGPLSDRPDGVERARQSAGPAVVPGGRHGWAGVPQRQPVRARSAGDGGGPAELLPAGLYTAVRQRRSAPDPGESLPAGIGGAAPHEVPTADSAGADRGAPAQPPRARRGREPAGRPHRDHRPDPGRQGPGQDPHLRQGAPEEPRPHPRGNVAGGIADRLRGGPGRGRGHHARAASQRAGAGGGGSRRRRAAGVHLRDRDGDAQRARHARSGRAGRGGWRDLVPEPGLPAERDLSPDGFYLFPAGSAAFSSLRGLALPGVTPLPA